MNRAAIAIATICLCGCTLREPAAIDASAERYVQLTLALAARDPDSLDFYAGPAALRRDADRQYRPLADVRRGLLTLREELGNDRNQRRQFLEDQTQALIARIDLLRGERWPFAEEARRLFGVSLPAPDLRDAEAARAALASRLPGNAKDLLQRFTAYRSSRLLAPGAVRAAFESAMAECRARTRAHIALPDDESVSVEYVPSRSPWSAFTRYMGSHHSAIEINTTFAFTREDVRDLACHEAYPGHHTAYVLADDALVKGEHRIEFTIEPMFGPHALLSEGAATYAPALAYPERADSIEALVERLDPVRLAIAASYLDGQLEFARAANRLERETLVPDAGPVLKFLNEFRSYVVTYTAGREMVARVVGRYESDDARWSAYRRLLLAGTLPAAP